MSYQTFEQSVQDSKPVYKFLFVIGVQEYRYTSASYFISDSNGTYEPESIRASNVTQTNELAKNGVKIVLPRTNTLAKLFLGGVPEQTTSLTIYRGHDASSPDEFVTYWKGRVSGSDVGRDQVTLECEDVFTSMRRPGLRARYQKGCRHALYSSACGVNDYDYAQAAFIIAIDRFNIEVSGITDSNGVLADGSQYYLGGVVELDDGSKRSVLAQSGTTLRLYRPFENVVVDSTPLAVTLYPGCAHNVAACRDKFDNLDNYGGFPYLPGKNPFSGSVTGSIA